MAGSSGIWFKIYRFTLPCCPRGLPSNTFGTKILNLQNEEGFLLQLPKQKIKTVLQAILLVLYEKVRSSQETTWICKIRSPKEKYMFHSMAMCYSYTVYTQRTLMRGMTRQLLLIMAHEAVKLHTWEIPKVAPWYTLDTIHFGKHRGTSFKSCIYNCVLIQLLKCWRQYQWHYPRSWWYDSLQSQSWFTYDKEVLL